MRVRDGGAWDGEVESGGDAFEPAFHFCREAQMDRSVVVARLEMSDEFGCFRIHSHCIGNTFRWSAFHASSVFVVRNEQSGRAFFTIRTTVEAIAFLVNRRRVLLDNEMLPDLVECLLFCHSFVQFVAIKISWRTSSGVH